MLNALIPKWIHKLIFATSEQLPVYKYDRPSTSSLLVTAHSVNAMFKRQIVEAIAAQRITPIFQPENLTRDSATRLIDSRIEGSLNDDLCIEEASDRRNGAEEMYDRRLHLLLACAAFDLRYSYSSIS